MCTVTLSTGIMLIRLPTGRRPNARQPSAGELIAAQPGLTLSDPAVSILWGVLAFHERVQGGPIHLLMAALSTVALGAAVVVLARSPLLSDDQQQDPEEGQSRSRGKPAAERVPSPCAELAVPPGG